MTIVPSGMHKPMALPLDTDFFGKILPHQQGFAEGIRAGNRQRYLASGERVARNQMVQFSQDIKQIEHILKQLPISMRDKVIVKATRAAAIIVRKQAQRFLLDGSVPHGPDEGVFPGDSKKTGTYEKKSKQQKAARDMRKSMAKSMAIKPKKYNNGNVVLMMVGPKRPEGNQSHILEFGGVIQLWGTDLQYRLKPRPFLEPAGQITVPAQRSAYFAKTKAEWKIVAASLNYKQRGAHA